MNAKEKKNSEGKKKSAISHNFEGGSPLKLREVKSPIKKHDKNTKQSPDSSVIKSLSKFLSQTQQDTKKELIKENKMSGSKSLLDERNIL
jgi:hypothetical protein